MTSVIIRRTFLTGATFSVAGLVLFAGIFLGDMKAQAEGRPAGGILQGFRTNVPEPPEWIRKTRPSDAVLYDRRSSVPAAEPEGAPMSADRLRQLEAEMNALRRRQERSARRAPAPAGRSAAAVTREKKEKTARPCVLTCNIGLGRVRRK